MKEYLLKRALKEHFALGAFNFASLETLKAILASATKCNSPVILQVSEQAMNFVGDGYLKALISATREEATVPISFHLDHGKSLDSVKRAIDIGCDSVMIDASMLPFEDNVSITSKICEYAHERGVFVEAELGSLAGVEDDVNVAEKDSFYTSPQQAKEFVDRTGVDSLAIAIGTKHGAYKYSSESKLNMDILHEIERLLPDVPLVLHGASGVDKEYVDKLYDLGVDIRGAKGVSREILEEVSKTNICKINGDTDIRIALLIGLLSDINQNKSNIDYRKYLSSGMREVAALVEDKLNIYGSVNKA